MLLINTLRVLYYEKFSRSVAKCFANLLVAREMIERVINNGRIDTKEATKKKEIPKKKEGKTQSIFFEHPLNEIMPLTLLTLTT